jgi:hypothetical protein
LLDAGLRGVSFTTFNKRSGVAIDNSDDSDPEGEEAHYNTMLPVLLPFILPKGYDVVYTQNTASDGQIDMVIETPSRIFLCTAFYPRPLQPPSLPPPRSRRA